MQPVSNVPTACPPYTSEQLLWSLDPVLPSSLLPSIPSVDVRVREVTAPLLSVNRQIVVIPDTPSVQERTTRTIQYRGRAKTIVDKLSRFTGTTAPHRVDRELALFVFKRSRQPLSSDPEVANGVFSLVCEKRCPLLTLALLCKGKLPERSIIEAIDSEGLVFDEAINLPSSNAQYLRYNALHVACELGYADLARLLLTKFSFHPDRQRYDGMTPDAIVKSCMKLRSPQDKAITAYKCILASLTEHRQQYQNKRGTSATTEPASQVDTVPITSLDLLWSGVDDRRSPPAKRQKTTQQVPSR